MSAISRRDSTDTIMEHGRVCGTREAAKLWDRYDPDSVTTKNLGDKYGSAEKQKLPRSETKEQELVS